MFLASVLPSLLAATLAVGPDTAASPPSLYNVHRARIDPFHSVLSFSVRHFGFTKVRGQFRKWNGTIMWDEDDITRSTFTVIVDVESLDTGLERRDNDLKSDNFFEVEKYSVIVIKSNRIERTADGYVAHADVTIRDVTKEVAIPFEFLGVREFGPPFRRIFASGKATVSRNEFGLTNARDRIAQSLAVVSDKVEFEIEIQAAVTNVGAMPFNSRETPSIGETLAETIEQEGIDAAVRQFYSIKEHSTDEYNFTRTEMLVLAFKLRDGGKTREAVVIGKLALEMEEPSVDAYLTLALAHQANGDLADSIETCKRALELDPSASVVHETLRWLMAE